ncbi:hypothetical protein FOZ61_004514 [Perkinsus olseni]|uniref:Uncharacterized protein n=1 Tax=Perkinsus olseni TaxID=32597 RepID=A0A7J6LKU9_PEROL|nr:hypothetical protein FOZ61_004514 [Perkinsus olseni]
MEATTEGHCSSELGTEEVAVKTDGDGSGRKSGDVTDEGVAQEARRPTFEEELPEHEGSEDESSAVEALGVDVAVADDGAATEKARPAMRSGRTMRVITCDASCGP